VPGPPKQTNPSADFYPRTREYRAQQIDDLRRWLGFLAQTLRDEGHLDADKLVYTAVGLGEAFDALALTFHEDSLTAVTNMAEVSIAFHQALGAMQKVVRRYVESMPRTLDLYRWPCGRGFSYVADDSEAAELAANLSEHFVKFADSLSPAIEASDTAVRHSMDFCAPPAAVCTPSDAPSTALYFWFDADGALLYIGITGDLAARQTSHAKRSSWSQFADHAKVQRFPSRVAAKVAEEAAIVAERPLFNKQHNDSPEARARLVQYLIERGRADLLAPAVSRG